MGRISVVDKRNATGRAKKLLDAVNKEFGMTPNMFKAMALFPGGLDAFLYFKRSLSTGVLSEKLRIQIALAIAEVNQSQYCLSYNTSLAKVAGLSDCEIADGRKGTARETRSSAVLRFAKSVANSSGHVTNDELDSIRKAVLTDTEIIEIVSNVALNLFANYVNSIVQTPLGFRKVSSMV